MRSTCLTVIVPGVLALMALVVVVMLFVVKLLWAWTVPDLFPGAVEQGLIAAEISWLAAFKVALIVGILAGIGGGARNRDQ